MTLDKKKFFSSDDDDLEKVEFLDNNWYELWIWDEKEKDYIELGDGCYIDSITDAINLKLIDEIINWYEEG